MRKRRYLVHFFALFGRSIVRKKKSRFFGRSFAHTLVLSVESFSFLIWSFFVSLCIVFNLKGQLFRCVCTHFRSFHIVVLGHR